MRILFYNYEFPPIGGGGGNATARLFEQFSENRSLTIDCITSVMGTEDIVESFSSQIRLYRLAVGKRNLHYWTQQEVLKYLWRAQQKTRELKKKHSYNLCHSFFGFPSGLLAWMQRHQIPYLISLRGSDVPGFNSRFSVQYRVLAPLFRRIWESAEAVVANSVGLRNLAQKFYPDCPVRVIPNGIDTRMFNPSGKRASAQVLCVSRLVERKGVQHLIDAMPIVLQSIPEARLLIVGEGNLERQLAQRVCSLGIENQVVFRGYVPHSDLPDLYRGASVFVLPSFFEGMSNTVLEAMASGLPVVASAEGGREELFHGNALHAPFGNRQALAEAVIELLEDSDKASRMGSKSRELALNHSWSKVGEQYYSIYTSLANKQSEEAV